MTNKTVKTIATILVLFGLMAPAVSQTPRSAKPSRSSELTAAKAYCEEVDSFLKQHRQGNRYFAKVASARKNVPGSWQEFKSKEELANADIGDNLPETAVVWLRDGKVIGVLYISHMRWRDWTQYVTYIFREDGSLVKTHETFNTAYARMNLERQKLYGRKGNLLHTSTEHFDFRTGAPRKPNGFASVPAPNYKSVRRLPFYSLF